MNGISPKAWLDEGWCTKLKNVPAKRENPGCLFLQSNKITKRNWAFWAHNLHYFTIETVHSIWEVYIFNCRFCKKKKISAKFFASKNVRNCELDIVRKSGLKIKLKLQESLKFSEGSCRNSHCFPSKWQDLNKKRFFENFEK